MKEIDQDIQTNLKTEVIKILTLRINTKKI